MMIELVTSSTYWVLCLLWLIIFILYLAKIKEVRASRVTVTLLLTLLSIDAFRTLFESLYFGLYFNSMFGFLPDYFYEVLSNPKAIIIPKIVNIVAGVIILTLLIRRWVPNEIQVHEEMITNLQDSHKKIQESENLFRTLIEKMPVSVVHFSRDGGHISRNERFVELFGYSEDIVATVDDWWLWAYPDPVYREEVMRTWEQAVERAIADNKDIEAIEYLVTCHSGEQRLVEISGTVLEDAILVTLIDLTEKKRVQAEIEKGRAEFAAIFNSISAGIAFVDSQRQIVRVNPAFMKMFGYQLEEIAGQTTQLLYADPACYLKLGQARFNPQAEVDQPHFETHYRRKDGTTFPGETIGVHVVDDTGTLLGYVGVIHDVSERVLAEEKRHELEAELRQTHKMDAIDTMAAGIAHNFNNNLTIILGNLEMIQNKLGDKSEEIEQLEHALVATRRSRDLVRKIMTFSRLDTTDRAPMQIIPSVEETVRLMRSTIPASIELTFRASEECQDITIDVEANRIEEALINLCNNAVHAMDEKGTLTISLDLVELQQDEIPNQFHCSQGTYARLSVQDTGCGMSPETQEKIFDPFFTTKGIDKGTGIGLSGVQGIMEQSGGLVKVYSELGQGARFDLCFPLVDQSGEEYVADEAGLLKGTEKILLVDDEEMVAQALMMMLSDMGYHVTVETCSLLALEKIHNEPNRFDLLFTDQTMPKMTGKQLAQEVSKINPDLSIILCTGDNSIVSSEELTEINACLTKPFEMATALQIVRDVLDEKKELSA